MPYIDIDLDDISTDDLIDELEGRYLDSDNKQSLSKLLTDEPSKKMRLFLNVMDRYSLFDLENLFNESDPYTPVPKEQLKLLFKE